MPTIKLNFINNSNDVNNSQVVIFQKNVATNIDEIAVAWTVISNCAPGWTHPFNYPLQSSIAASDSWGNYSPQLAAMPGQQFSIAQGKSGNELTMSGSATSASEIEVMNGLSAGAITANIFKDGRLLAAKTGVAPGQKAVFEFKPVIFIGVVSQIEEGQVMDSAVLSTVNTEISLLGIASADIVMTGGGPGAESTAFVFTLENVKYA